MSYLLYAPFVRDKLEAPEAFLEFVRVAKGLGMLGHLVEVLSAMPALVRLQPEVAHNLLLTLSSEKVSHTYCRHGLGDYMYTHLPLKEMQLEGLTGEQCGVLLELAVRNKQFYYTDVVRTACDTNGRCCSAGAAHAPSPAAWRDDGL